MPLARPNAVFDHPDWIFEPKYDGFRALMNIDRIMPPRFRWYNCDIYLPQKLTANPNIYFDISLKLRPGVTVARANSELQPYLEQFARESGNYPPGFRVSLRSITEAFATPSGPVLYLLFGAVSLLLFINPRCTVKPGF